MHSYSGSHSMAKGKFNELFQNCLQFNDEMFFGGQRYVFSIQYICPERLLSEPEKLPNKKKHLRACNSYSSRVFICMRNIPITFKFSCHKIDLRRFFKNSNWVFKKPTLVLKGCSAFMTVF